MAQNKFLCARSTILKLINTVFFPEPVLSKLTFS